MSVRNMEWSGKVLLFLCLCVWGGCQSPRHGWQLTVANSGADPIHDVRIALADGQTLDAGTVEGYAVSKGTKVGDQLPRGVINLTWARGGGQTNGQSLTLTNTTTLTGGRLVLEIKESRALRVFIQNAEGRFLEEIPWGNSADWDGTVLFPVSQE